MKKQFILHPFLIAIYPALFLYTHNISELRFDEFAVPAAIILSCSILIFLIVNLFVRDKKKSALFVSLFLIMFFSYGHVFEVLGRGALGMTRHRYFFGPWLALLFFGFYASVKTRRDLTNITSILNAVTLGLALFSTFSIARFGSTLDSKWIMNWNEEIKKISVFDKKKYDKLPNVYYIIFDRYSSEKALKANFGFDNSDLTGFLREKGFYVPSDSVCNRPGTMFSLASSLNMEHLDFVKDASKPELYSPKLFYMINNSKVITIFKRLGYKFILFGDWYSPTRTNRLADVTYKFGISKYMDDFSFQIFNKSIAGYMYDKVFKVQSVENSKRIIFDKIAKITETARGEDSPKLVFVHFLLTHPPYIFKRDGSGYTDEERAKLGNKGMYIEQMIYSNSLMKKLVENLINNSEVEPIIIIQGDEGPGAGNMNINKNINELSCSILNAYLLPKSHSNENFAPYDTISPVNTFRMIFNRYFGADYKMLPDTCDAPSDNSLND
ncbi:MAG: sulfatase-like hydrolase/transferase [bacterium]